MKPLNGIPQKPGTQLHIRLDERLRLAIQPGQGEPTEYTSFDEAAMNLQFDQATARRLGQALLKVAGLDRPRRAETAELFSGKVATRAPMVVPAAERAARKQEAAKQNAELQRASKRVALVRCMITAGVKPPKPGDPVVEQLAKDVALLDAAPSRWASMAAMARQALDGINRQPQQRAAPPTKAGAPALEVAS